MSPTLPPVPPGVQVAPHPAPARRSRGGAVVAVVVVLAATVVTGAVAYTAWYDEAGTSAHQVPNSPTPPPASRYTLAEQAAAKARVCKIFDESTSGQEGKGGVRVHGQLNVPIVLRTVGSVVALRNSLTPATPPEVADAARKYIDASLNLTTGAMGSMPTSELNQLNHVANAAADAMSDVCGLER